jgi:hypothetical protein
MPSAQAPLRRATLLATLAGAAASLGFMLYAGRHNPSRLLVLLFSAWVLSPFAAAVLAWFKSERWSTMTRATLYMAMLVIVLLSVWVYGAVAPGHLRVKVGFVFLVVPLASWVLLVVAVAVSAVRSRRSRTEPS